MKPEELEALDSLGEDLDSPTARKLSAILYGDFGIGKTTLTGQIIKAIGEPAILINTDSAWTVLQEDREVSKLIKRYPFDSFAAIRKMVQAHDEGYEPWVSYKVLSIDTVSTAVDRMLRILTKGKKFKEQQDPDLEAWPHYRMVANALKETIDVIKKSDLHVIYTAHLREPNDSDRKNKKFAIRPAMPEASFNVIAQEVNLLGWVHREVRGGPVRVQFEPTNEETAKSQIPTIKQMTYETQEIPNLIMKYLNS